MNHPDDLAVDRFAAALKLKLAQEREKGRGGWDDPAQCTAADLSGGLRVHTSKGDPLDVGAYAMMLWARGEMIVKNLPPLKQRMSHSELTEAIDIHMEISAERVERERAGVQDRRQAERTDPGRRRSDIKA